VTELTAVLARFDREVRRSLVPPQPGWLSERVGPVIRVTSPPGLVYGCYVEWSDLDADSADEQIAAQVEYFGGLGRRFEWKTYGYDSPADLPQRLTRAGFVAEDPETLVIGSLDAVTAACAGSAPPPGVRVRTIDAGDALAWTGIGLLHDLVWGASSGEWVQGLVSEVAADPAAITVLVAEVEASGEVVCAGWVRFHQGTGFASLWGGSTAPAYRGQGIYRTLVGQRAALAAQRGFDFLQVDASPDSRPILQRLGLQVVSTTTPYVWSPPG
jgi:ribosomal protein S18 acetylase RimI-like enzyme